MKSFATRFLTVTTLVGLAAQGFVADAGWRHLRMFRSSCAAPSCAGCFAPVGCHTPMMSCSAPTCSGPAYVTPPMMVSACSAPVWGCSAPACGGPMYSMPSCSIPACAYPTLGGAGNYLPPYGSQSFSGLNSSFGFAPTYGSVFPPEANLSAAPFPGLAAFGGAGFGHGAGSGPLNVPDYYAPMSAQYAPIPPAPASDLVW